MLRYPRSEGVPWGSTRMVLGGGTRFSSPPVFPFPFPTAGHRAEVIFELFFFSFSLPRKTRCRVSSTAQLTLISYCRRPHGKKQISATSPALGIWAELSGLDSCTPCEVTQHRRGAS